MFWILLILGEELLVGISIVIMVFLKLGCGMLIMVDFFILFCLFRISLIFFG